MASRLLWVIFLAAGLLAVIFGLFALGEVFVESVRVSEKALEGTCNAVFSGPSGTPKCLGMSPLGYAIGALSAISGVLVTGLGVYGLTRPNKRDSLENFSGDEARLGRANQINNLKPSEKCILTHGNNIKGDWRSSHREFSRRN